MTAATWKCLVCFHSFTHSLVATLTCFLVVAWKHRYASQCLAIVHDQAFGARTPTYKTIQDLDKKVRNWYIPQSLQVPGFGGAKSSGVDSAGQPSTELSMQRYCAFAIKEMSKLLELKHFAIRTRSDLGS